MNIAIPLHNDAVMHKCTGSGCPSTLWNVDKADFFFKNELKENVQGIPGIYLVLFDFEVIHHK